MNLPEQFKISSVEPDSKPTSKDRVVYKVTLEGANEVYDLLRADNLPTPTPGETITGWMGMSKYGGNRYISEAREMKMGKDENAIKAMWAIGQAVQLFDKVEIKKGATVPEWLETHAKYFYSLVDKVKKENKDVG